MGRAWGWGARGSVWCTLWGPGFPSFFPVVSPCWFLPKAGNVWGVLLDQIQRKSLEDPPRVHLPHPSTSIPSPCFAVPRYASWCLWSPALRLLSTTS